MNPIIVEICHFQIMSGGVKCLNHFMLLAFNSMKKESTTKCGYVVVTWRKLSSHTLNSQQ